jgi:putative membrane protein
MKPLSLISSIALLGLATSTLAQTPAAEPRNPDSSNPAAASSPHQREATHGTHADSTKMASSGDAAMGGPVTPKTFVTKAAQDGMTEVEVGKLAQSKAQSPEVKKFAERMVKDHGKANTELETIAAGKSLQVPKKLDAEHQSMVQELSGKSGAEFDSAYSQHMAKAHAKAVALFESASKLDDSELAAFAKKTLPTLKEHKQMADGLKSGSREASTGDASTSR